MLAGQLFFLQHKSLLSTEFAKQQQQSINREFDMPYKTHVVRVRNPL